MLAAADTLGVSPIDPGLEALMFAMYMVAATSMSSEACVRQLGQDREKLLAQFKYGTEAALANADFLSSMEMVTLQALTIYLVSGDSLGSLYRSKTCPSTTEGDLTSVTFFLFPSNQCSIRSISDKYVLSLVTPCFEEAAV